MSKEIPRFSDFAEEDTPLLIGKKVNIDNIIDEDIVITTFTVSKSRQVFTEIVTIYLKLKDQNFYIRTSSSNLKSQIEKYSNKLPFVTKIVKIGRNYVFV